MSSSSSSSSTHSSQFSSNFQSKSNHNNSNNSAASSVVAANRSDPGQNFSLIAKYFASFPATRLAKTNSQIFSENAASYLMPKSTPFLPFKKANTIDSNYSSGENVQSTFVLRSHTNAHQQPTNTDHLCTNFRRMIKLNDPESPFFTNIRNSSPAAPGNATLNEQASSHTQQFNSINFYQVRV